MRRSGILVAGIAIALAGFGQAHAADLQAAPVAPEPSDGKPLYVWSGPYAGAFAGYNSDDFDNPDDTGDGAMGGGFAGYNWQHENYVFGVEADLGYSGADAEVAGLKADQELFGSVRGRMGYAFDNPFMVYATGGIAGSNLKLDDGDSSDTKTHVGWTAGAGAEASITDNVTARVEYRYSDYGSKNYDLPDSGPVSSGFDEQSVRAGIGIKF
ncbi:outer membrane protein [Pararhizobium mangrovi]|uniref:Porin family protein n=1 Tax=Pararhizobium mangrovi TaxID=2590452 RepID=A0A506UGB5_9HYPH|nr:outer membrane protein [Pararhizobium mangrovi]TPW32059.1 porin family protein [Pararhizobium mangrovi]